MSGYNRDSDEATGKQLSVYKTDALRDKAKEVVSAIRSINRSRHQQVPSVITGDDEPCYWQRKEWIDWMLELASELETAASGSDSE